MAARVPYTFAIVGTQKGATGTLMSTLTRHRLVSPGPKEIHFFDDETRDWTDPDYQDYARVPRKPVQQISGDASPSYLFWPQALERMRRFKPDMRLIASFRDPIERAFSQWSMHRGKLGAKYPEFATVIHEHRPKTLREGQAGAGTRGYRPISLVVRGYYGAQLRDGLEQFPQESWLLLDFHTVFKDQRVLADLLTDHVGLPRFEKYPTDLHRLKSPEGIDGEPVRGEHLEGLAELYADDLQEFTELSGIDVSGWSTSRILQGTLDPLDLADKLNVKAGLVGQQV